MSQSPMSKPGEVAGWPKLVVRYRTDPEGVAELLPPGFTPGPPEVSLNFYCVPILGEPEFGVSVRVAASWNGEPGVYTLGIGIDQEAAIFSSIERNGQPKFPCDVSYYRLGQSVHAKATHQGYTFAEFNGSVTQSVPPAAEPLTEREWWTKYSRAIGGIEGRYDFAPHVVRVESVFEQHHLEDVDGELKLLESPWDPISHYLPVREQLSAQLVTHESKSRSITKAGTLDPQAFWPYADTIGGSRWPGQSGGPKPLTS